MPLRTCAAAVAPDEVPITKSAASARSRPASARPAMIPISHAFPAAPPPPRTRATLWTICIGVAFRECHVVEALPATPTSIARSDRYGKGEHPHPYSVHGSHLLSRFHGRLKATSPSIIPSNPFPSHVITTPNGP